MLLLKNKYIEDKRKREIKSLGETTEDLKAHRF